MIDKNKLKEIKKLEEEYRQIIRDKYKDLAKHLIGKFFKTTYKAEPNVHGDIDHSILLYVHGCDDHSLSCIKFDGIQIYRSGEWIEGFDYEEITKEQFIKELEYYDKLFHFNECIKPITNDNLRTLCKYFFERGYVYGRGTLSDQTYKERLDVELKTLPSSIKFIIEEQKKKEEHERLYELQQQK